MFIFTANKYFVKKKINIAIDGYSSCGKSTLAKAIAKELNYVYLDTGAMYRAVSLYALKNGIIRSGKLNKKKLKENLQNIYITFKYNPDSGNIETYLNTKNVEKEIRSIQVSNYVSQVSEVKEVRKKMVKLQKRIAESNGVVMDGRDIGTVVLPDAEVKIFMIADNSVRAQRRFDELVSKGQDITLKEITENIEKRDLIDTTRTVDPLIQAEDAVILDNTNLTEEEQFQFVLGQIFKNQITA